MPSASCHATCSRSLPSALGSCRSTASSSASPVRRAQELNTRWSTGWSTGWSGARGEGLRPRLTGRRARDEAGLVTRQVARLLLTRRPCHVASPCVAGRAPCGGHLPRAAAHFFAPGASPSSGASCSSSRTRRTKCGRSTSRSRLTASNTWWTGTRPGAAWTARTWARPRRHPAADFWSGKWGPGPTFCSILKGEKRNRGILRQAKVFEEQ